MTKDEKVLEVSNQILDFLLKYRAEHPRFKFWLRTKDSSRAKDKLRLARGQWFQGSDYIFISFHNGSGGVNMTRSIGWVLTFDDSLNPKYGIEIVWPGEQDQLKIKTYKQIIEKLGGSYNAGETKSIIPLSNGEILENLAKFIETNLPEINNIIETNGANSLFIPDEKFEKQLAKVLEIRKQLNQGKTPERIQEELTDETYPSMNTILFGPPGTGKTYNTINHAVAIIEGNTVENIAKENRIAVKGRYDRYVKEKRIWFCTFHQSLNYEDFIEGIKPKLNKEQVIYEIEDGIFKDVCTAANVLKGNFDEVITKFRNDISEPDGKEPKLIEAPSTHFLVTYRGTNVFYVQPKNTTKEKPWYPVNIANILKAFDSANYVGIYNPTYVREIISFLVKEYGLVKGNSKKNEAKKPYVLIIDEINRGNIAQIFGELITLIEDGKRKDQPECIELILPYSKEVFSVPDNVYLIGTMNTADRSVEALDTALRRRFVFEEMQPKPELLSPQRMIWRLWWNYKGVGWKDKKYLEKENGIVELLGIADENNDEDYKESIWAKMHKEGINDSQVASFNDWKFSGINLEQLLRSMNERLTMLIDKDHTIGHAWLMGVASINELKSVFQNKIIPLLQEFFYNDYGKIGLVLGEQFFEETPKINVDIFAGFKNVGMDTRKELLAKPTFKLKLPDDDDIVSAFQSIYQRKVNVVNNGEDD